MVKDALTGTSGRRNFRLIPINAAIPSLRDHGGARGSSVAHSETLFPPDQRSNRQARAIPRDTEGRLPHESEFLRQMGDRVREMRALRGLSRRELAPPLPGAR